MRLLPFLFLLLFPLASQAAGAIVPLPAIGSAVPPATFPDYIRYFFVAAIGLAGISALLMIAIAGIQYSVSGVVDTKARAKGQITNALLGLALILLSYIFLRTINPDLVNLRLPSLTPAILQGKLPEYAPEGARVDLSIKKQCAQGLEVQPKNDPQGICVRTQASRLEEICARAGRTYDPETTDCVTKPTPPGTSGTETSKEEELRIEFEGAGWSEAVDAEKYPVNLARPIPKGRAGETTLGLSQDAFNSWLFFKQEFEADCRRAIGETCTLEITSTTEPRKASNPCHILGSPTAGTCADMAIRTATCKKVTPDCPLREEVIDQFHLTATLSQVIFRCADEYNGTSKYKNGDHFHCSFARIK